MKGKNIVVFACALCVGFSAQAQHEFALGIGGGLSMMTYEPTGKSGLTYGGLLGIDYAYYFAENWGIGMGMNLSLYSGKYMADDINGHFPTLDMENKPFGFYYNFTDYVETHRSYMLVIPIMLHYQSGMFYMSLGAKAGVPFYTSYTNRAMVNTYGDYSTTTPGLRLDAPTFVGFGRFENVSGTNILNLSSAFFLSAQIGIKWNVGSRALYTGIYADYGLNSVYQTFGAPQKYLLDYDNSPNRDYNKNSYQPNSVFHSQSNGKALIEKVNLFAVGIKIAITLTDNIDGSTDSYSSSSSGTTDKNQSSPMRSGGTIRETRTTPSVNPYVIRPHGNAEICLYITGDEGKKFDISEGASLILSDATYEYIDDKIEHLRLHPNTNVIIGGQNCCMCMGPISPQVELARIHTTRRYLIMNGIAERRISVKINNVPAPVPDIPAPMENVVPTSNLPSANAASDSALPASNVRYSASRTRTRTNPRTPSRPSTLPADTTAILTYSSIAKDTISSAAIRTAQRSNDKDKYILYGQEYE